MASNQKFRFDESTRQLVARLWRDWMRRYLGRIVAAAALMGVVAATTGAYPLIIERAVDTIERNDTRMLLVLPFLIIAVTFIKGSASYGQAVLAQSVAFRVIADMQKAMFAHLMRADLATFQRDATGKLISRFTNDVRVMRDAVAKSLTGIARDALTVLVLVGAMFWLDWVLALIVVVIFPLSAMPIVRIGRRLRRASAHAQQEMGEATAALDQAFGGARLIKAYRLEEQERRRANALFDRLYTLSMKLVRGRSRTYPILETLGGAAVAAVLAYGGFRIIGGTGTLGEFTGFLSAVMIAYQPVRGLGNLNASLQEGLAAVKRSFDLLDSHPTIVDQPDAKPLRVSGGTIELHGLSFRYDAEAPALDDVSIVVPAGRTVALVGPSGAGKSTVLNMIPRFYDPEAGAVTIDGQDAREVTLASLRDRIAFVSQDVILFNDTVRANIAFGRPDAGEEEIVAAARDADAHDFVARLPEGYDTVLGERGVKLSGGEKQRIAIARAMLKDAPILLLDEATSALDSESERQVQLALARLTRGRTTLVIAHRLSTVMGADLIIVMDRGRVVEQGTHASLLAAGGLYARLCQLQFRKDAVLLGAVDEGASRIRA
ncbi:MAG: ABC transporter ATP-binding protein [Alphaproteobacteria bacterium]